MYHLPMAQCVGIRRCVTVVTVWMPVDLVLQSMVVGVVGGHGHPAPAHVEAESVSAAGNAINQSLNLVGNTVQAKRGNPVTAILLHVLAEINTEMSSAQSKTASLSME
jgi:hypothetical protein